ncbi:catechol O-methyltransferase-like [Styela clava]
MNQGLRIRGFQREDLPIVREIVRNGIYGHSYIGVKIRCWRNCKVQVRVVLGDAHEVISQLKEKYGIEKIDLVLLDNGCENYKGNLVEMLDARLIQKSSVGLCDNILYPVFAEARDYKEFVRAHKRFHSTFFDTHLEYTPNVKDGIEKSTYLG